MSSAALLDGLLAAGWAIVLFLPFQIRRSWDMPWLPFALPRFDAFRIRLEWVPA